MERQSELRTMHLFAGAGGGILGDLILGHQPIVAVEWDNYCCNVLRERVADGWFEGMHVWEGDVSVFDPSEYEGRVDCIHAGFPCQDISVAGRQAGVDSGTRSGLYREVLRIADEVRPQFLFLENVSAIVTGNDGGWLRTVVGDLAERGFDATWTCLSAAEVGASHVRNRWWLLAYPSSLEQPIGINGSLTEGSETATPEGIQPSCSPSGVRAVPIQRWRTKENIERSQRADREDVSNAESRDRNGHDPNRGDGQSEAQEIPRDGDCLLGGSTWWEVESSVGRVAHGVPDTTHRLKALGNGQVPLQAAAAFDHLWKVMKLKTPDARR